MLTELLQSPVEFSEALVVIGFSMMASIAIYFMYQAFYGAYHIGAGVHRTFLIGGPAIAVLFLAVQTSIPLSLGLLGALSIVRFRTPVKDPAETGFLLLLVAASIGAATQNYLITMLLLLVVFVVFGIQKLIKNRFGWVGRGQLMISVDKVSYLNLEDNLTILLEQQLRGLSLETVSVLDSRVSLHYQYRHQPGFDWTAFIGDLNRLVAPNQPNQIEVFVSP